jgi:hypothetical protein
VFTSPAYPPPVDSKKPKKTRPESMSVVTTPFTTATFEQLCFIAELLIRLREDVRSAELDTLLHR